MRKVIVPAVLLVLVAIAMAIGGCSKPAANEPAALPSGNAQTAPVGGANTITVFVPCGILGPFEDVKTILRRTNPELQIKDHTANTTVLTRLLVNGKETCDVYLALGDGEVAELQKAGKVAKAVRVAGNGLGLVVAKGNPTGIKSLQDLASDKVKTIAIPSSINTVGIAAEQALKQAGIWDKVSKKLVRLEMPSDVQLNVAAGKADAAIVYSTCMTEVHKANQAKLGPGQGQSNKVQVIGQVDQKLYTPFFVHAVILTDAPNPRAAEIFISTLLSPDGQSKLADWDFVPLAKAPKPAGG